MDNETPDLPPVAEAATDVVDPADRAYAAAVIANQAEIELAAAEAHADQLPPDQLAALVDAGRNGRVDECRQILGLE